MADFDTSAEDAEAIRAWFDEWGAEVARRDFASARRRFDPEVLGFGTWMDHVEGWTRWRRGNGAASGRVSRTSGTGRRACAAWSRRTG